MKAKIYDINGKEKEKIELPECFSFPIREDIISKYVEAKKTQQPYAPLAIAGKQQSASGVLVHQRKVWKSQYGKGMSRIPRKIMWRKGSQFNWEGAFSPNTKGGRRAHPPKIVSMLKKLKINKKESQLAFYSALSATANKEFIKKRYESLKEYDLKEAPFIIESKINEMKTKEILKIIKNILGENLFEIGLKKKRIRSGKGKMRGRKYKSNAGLLFVVGKEEKLKLNAFEVISTTNLGVNDLAKGGDPGRITIYTEKAIKELEGKYKNEK